MLRDPQPIPNHLLHSDLSFRVEDNSKLLKVHELAGNPIISLNNGSEAHCIVNISLPNEQVAIYEKEV